MIETERLALRPITMDDVDLLVSLDSDPEVMRYLTGGKPSNTNRSAGTPAADSAATTALEPGTGTTGTPAARASRTSRKPGSEMPGVPASVTSATDLPSASWRRSCGPRASLLCSK